LQGEAFFDVKHLNRDETRLKEGDHFTVHLQGLDIEVLGTSFNIRSRRGKTEVVLQSGKIKVSFKNKDPDIIMKPDDIIVYNQAENKITRNITVARDYTGWKERRLVLHDPTISEILNYLEDNFGKKIILEKKDLGSKKIEGPILFNDLDDALFVISTVLQAEVIKEGNNTIIIRVR
jgi:ferric-dicitrate binding protein FerR (iron transport regulator)